MVFYFYFFYFIIIFYLSSINGIKIRIGQYGLTRLMKNHLLKRFFKPKTHSVQKIQWTVRTRIWELWLVSRVRLKLEKKKKKKEEDGGIDVMPFSPLNSGFLSLIFTTNPKMQSQNTPSPQNKIVMKSTNLIFTLLLLRFPVFLLQYSVFSFCIYSSCLFRVSFLLLSLVPKVAKPKEIKKSKSKWMVETWLYVQPFHWEGVVSAIMVDYFIGKRKKRS